MSRAGQTVPPILLEVYRKIIRWKKVGMLWETMKN